ncbi:sulfotransferase family protein, partial [Aeromonas veronii]|nr:sulfotransferase family protein [Aeromonas veronii]
YALFLDTELIAVERLKHMQRLDAQLLEMSAALSHAERLVAEQQEAFKSRDEMQIRFQKTEVHAFERLEEMQKLNVQLMRTTDALDHAERIVEKQQEALARAEAELVASRVEATRELVAESVQEAQKLDPQIK